MNLVALVDAPDHVCCRYRVEAFRPALERAGHTLETLALPKRWWSRWGLFRRLRGATVLLQRFLLPGWQLALLRRSVGRLLFDIDDAVFLRDSYSKKGLFHPGRQARFAATVKASDVIVAGNSYLGDHAARWAGVHRVHIVPTCVDPGGYNPAGAARGGTDLVWIGSSSTLQGLEAITPLLNEVGKYNPEVRLKVICDRFPTFTHLPVVDCPWSKATEAAELASADIGIAWVPDDDWSRGKCGLKVLQYMAAGLPVIANPVGVQVDMVRHGETGYLAATAQEWSEAVRRLTRDASLRQRMGQAGRRLLEDRYSVQAGGNAWVALLGQLETAQRAA